jgi:hypothetical protein
MEFTPPIALRPPEMIRRLASAELAEVLGRLGHRVCEEFELDPAQGLACSSSVPGPERVCCVT